MDDKRPVVGLKVLLRQLKQMTDSDYVWFDEDGAEEIVNAIVGIDNIMSMAFCFSAFVAKKIPQLDWKLAASCTLSVGGGRPIYVWVRQTRGAMQL